MMVSRQTQLQVAFANAQALQEEGRFAEAERAWLDLEKDIPSHAGVLVNLAMAQWQLGALEKAEGTAARAIGVGPEMEQAHAIYAAAAEARGANSDAIKRYERALELKPQLTSVIYSLANLHRRQGGFEKALYYAKRLTVAKPRWAKAHDAVGAILLAIGDLVGAGHALNYAVQLDPTLASAHGNLGMLKAERREWTEALEHLEAALSLAPNMAEAQNNRGNVLISLDRLPEAEAAFSRALELDPESTDAHFNQSLLWLKQGKWQEAWPGFESRWQTRELAPFRRLFKKPLWDGKATPNHTLLVHGEQGAGDLIMVLRYLPMLEERVGQVVIECPRELRSLINAMPGYYKCVTFGDSLPAFDMHLPAMSLPGIFKTMPETIPWNGPYIPAPDSAITTIPIHKGINIGLTWTGSKLNPTNDERSITLTALKPLFEIENCKFFSLQHGPAGDEIRTEGFADKIIDMRPEMTDFAATACLISKMDLVISVCTSVAHLAAAMGKTTWIMLAAVADWRWLVGREDTPWYPSAQLFRQSDLYDWSTVVASVSVELQTWSANKQNR